MSYTAQDVIKTFMSTLDTTTSTGLTALDEAVAACSSFSSASDWISSFTTACQDDISAGETSSEILSSLCGINLTNTDTGAITGSDAGDSTTKTAESIIAESGTAKSPTGTTSTINNLLVTWPTTSYDNRMLTSTEKYIIANLNTWWIPESLSLLTESYGMSFGESGTSVNKINVKFVYEANSNTLAYTSWAANTSTDKATSLTLSINMYYYNNINTSDNNGIASNASSYYLDRVIAHELTHALMAANISYSTMSDLPLFITEGLAELVHGVDDERESEISSLISDVSSLSSALSLTSSNDYYSYAAGYMALRYLAKYASSSTTLTGTFVPTSSIYYNSTYSTLTVTSSNAASIWLDGRTGTTYEPTVTKLDASASSGKNILAGNTNSNLVIAGSGSSSLWGGAGTESDTLQGGSGTDTFFYGSGEGSDTITDYSSQTDTIDFFNGSISSISVSGSDILLGSSSGSLTIKESAGSLIKVIDSSGTTYNAWIGKNTANSQTYSSDVNYYLGSASYTDTLCLTGNDNIWLNNTTSTIFVNIDNLDASASTGQVTLAGSESGNLIIGGQGTSSLWGGSGQISDTLQGGSGADTFFVGNNEGSDYITNSNATDKVIIFSSDYTYTGATLNGQSLVITSDTGTTLTISDWSESGMNIFQLADGNQFKFVQNGTTITPEKI